MTTFNKLGWSIALAFLVGGCGTFGEKKEKPLANSEPAPDYVSISPISLPPLAADIKADLHEIASNIQGAKSVTYDTDLLVLPSSMNKVQYRFFEVDSKLTGAGGVFSASGEFETRKAVYDLMQMASHPLPILLYPLDKDGRQDMAAKPFTVQVTPFVGVGVRVVATYQVTGGSGNLSLPVLAAELQSKKGSGSIEIQQIGISRYGANNQGVTGVELTPSSVEAALRSIGYMMGQIWLSDTRVQPMIVGYSVPGNAKLPFAYHPHIVDQLISRIDGIVRIFNAQMFYEALDAYGISSTLQAKDGKPATTNALITKLSNVKKVALRQQSEADTITEVALVDPSLLPFLSSTLLSSEFLDEMKTPAAAKESLLPKLRASRDAQKLKQAN